MSVSDMVDSPILVVPEKVSKEAPWRWLAAGWQDIWRKPLFSLSYGLVFVLIGLAITAGLWQIGMSSTIPVAAGAFALVGPLMAVGLYEMSRRYQTGESLNLKGVVLVQTASPIHLFYVGFLLLFALMVWSRIALMLYALFISGTYLPLSAFAEFVFETPQGLSMLVVGTAIGGIIAFAIFAMTAFAVPLLMDRNMDALEAVVRSIQVIFKNPVPMMIWAWLIAGLLAIGTATGFLGLIIIFPLLGHATWHAYDDLFGAIKR